MKCLSFLCYLISEFRHGVDYTDHVLFPLDENRWRRKGGCGKFEEDRRKGGGGKEERGCYDRVTGFYKIHP